VKLSFTHTDEEYGVDTILAYIKKEENWSEIKTDGS